ncbi:MAG: hypothetical protein RMJ54_19615, partial [Roseiflexaceae bacterium]|nr:hypothetical protein [Roseiflexaceae bacterium]
MNIAQLINRALELFGARIVSTAPDKRETQRLRDLRQRNHWSQAKYTAGLDLEETRFLSFLEQVCTPYYEALARIPRTATEADGGYYFDNIWFGPIDG